MSQERLPSPQPDDCLIHSRKSRFKGGTIIAEEVWTLEEHLRRISDPDGYRPCACGNCGNTVLHVHDYLERKPLGLTWPAVVRVVRFICINPDCRATWRILPAWLARHLWWTWGSVEQSACANTEESKATAAVAATPPERTQQRWQQRLASSARHAVVLMVSRGAEIVRAIGEAVGLQGTRRELVDSYGAIIEVPRGHVLGAVAAVLDRLERGVRLM
jgi:hypothetical protein